MEAGHVSRRKLSSKDFRALQGRAVPGMVRYPLGGGRAELRVPGKRQRRQEKGEDPTRPRTREGGGERLTRSPQPSRHKALCSDCSKKLQGRYLSGIGRPSNSPNLRRRDGRRVDEAQEGFGSPTQGVGRTTPGRKRGAGAPGEATTPGSLAVESPAGLARPYRLAAAGRSGDVLADGVPGRTRCRRGGREGAQAVAGRRYRSRLTKGA